MRFYLKMIALIVIVSVTVGAEPSYGQRIGKQILDQAAKDYLIIDTLKNFWGNAKDSLGKVIEPVDEEDRNTLPISYEEAYRVIDNAVPFVAAEWCQVSWGNYYNRYLHVERLRNAWNDRQSAYINMLLTDSIDAMLQELLEQPCSADARFRAHQKVSYGMKQMTLDLRRLTKGE